MKILITGGTGFIGQYLIPNFLNKNYEVIVLSRNPSLAAKALPSNVKVISKLESLDSSARVEGIINLAGDPIDKGRWSQKKKRAMLGSRLAVTQGCVDLIKRLAIKPKWFISGSAIGFYGPQGEEILDESGAFQAGFTHDLCHRWEQTALQAQGEGVRVCLLRTGVVLGRGGGALQKMLTPFRLGLGGRLGSGQQWFSWIHQEDLRRLIMLLMEQDALEGPVNATSPYPVTNQELTKNLAKALNRPCFFPLPGFVVKLLFGEMGDQLLLHGQRVIPKKVLESDFHFQFPRINEALDDILKK